MAKKNFIEQNKSTITYVVGIGIGGFVIYKLLQKFGIIASAQDVANQQLVDSFAGANSQLQVDTPIQVTSNNSNILLDTITVKQLVEDLNNSKGFLNDDEQLVFSTFRKLKNKSQLNQLISEFNNTQQKNLYDYLNSFLNTNEFATVLNIIKTIP
jgi:hypothetical protein